VAPPSSANSATGEASEDAIESSSDEDATPAVLWPNERDDAEVRDDETEDMDDDADDTDHSAKEDDDDDDASELLSAILASAAALSAERVSRVVTAAVVA
jgi:hypothetical protein